MTISLPSREIYVIDVPEVRDFSGHFVYNFFTPDESVNETGGIPEKFLNREAGEIDADFLQFAVTRAPRYVTFNFTPPRLADVGDEVTNVESRENVFDRNRDSRLIADNIDKVISEDHFASFGHVSVNFHDAEIEDKIHYLVSGTLEQHTTDEDHDHNVSHHRSATRLRALLPPSIRPHFLSRGLSHSSNAHGSRHFSSHGVKHKPPILRPHGHGHKKAPPARHNKLRHVDKHNRRLHHVTAHVQINGKLFHDVIGRSIHDPHSPFGDDMHSLHATAKRIQTAAREKLHLQIGENDYKTIVPFVNLRVQRTAHHTDRRSAEIVGYIIDKLERTRDGKTKQHPPIIIENPRASSIADFKIRYGTRYVYHIRTVAQFTLPAIDDETGDIATIQVLVCSKPSNKVYVRTREVIAPPPPADFNFTWDYERDKLLLHWSFPPNAQRDIKKFQVFRRKSTTHPFELIKMYDFDDSLMKYENLEDPDPHLVEYLTSPAAFYVDDEFNRFGSKYIYAVASVDAHGLTSGYSAQFEVRFDLFKNKLVKRLISHTGAPKPYPNLYLEADTFVDTIHVSGPHSRKLKLYFNPEFYYISDDSERLRPIIATKQRKGMYKLLLINLDNQLSEIVTINIDDQLTSHRRRRVKKNHTPGRKSKMQLPP